MWRRFRVRYAGMIQEAGVESILGAKLSKRSSEGKHCEKRLGQRPAAVPSLNANTYAKDPVLDSDGLRKSDSSCCRGKANSTLQFAKDFSLDWCQDTLLKAWNRLQMHWRSSWLGLVYHHLCKSNASQGRLLGLFRPAPSSSVPSP